MGTKRKRQGRGWEREITEVEVVDSHAAPVSSLSLSRARALPRFLATIPLDSRNIAPVRGPDEAAVAQRQAQGRRRCQRRFGQDNRGLRIRVLRFRNEAPEQLLDEFRAARRPAAARHSAGEVALAIIVPAAGRDFLLRRSAPMCSRCVYARGTRQTLTSMRGTRLSTSYSDPRSIANMLF